MSAFFYPVYAVLHLVLLIWAIRRYVRTKELSTLLIAAVIFGVLYDNFALTLGLFANASSTMYALSLPRFYLHQLVLPWIIYGTFLQVRRAGHPWAQSRNAAIAILVLMLLTITLGILTRIFPMDLQPTVMDGVFRYVDEGASGPPIVSLVSIGFAGVMGGLLWRRDGWWWVLFAAVLVFIGEGIPSEFVRRVIGSGAEVFFLFTLLRTENWLETRSASPSR